ncbi:MAG: hypothetical protein CMK59_11510 [Proteobacteria bacterium]|nr:hypothetical protein [Pseudomonadota bacterium]
MSFAFGQTLVLDPQNTIISGLSQNDGNVGISVSLDSRLSQLISVNVGAFYSFRDKAYVVDEDDMQTWISLSKALWVAPGIRWPHRYKENSLNWDLFFRAGFACVSSGNAFDKDWFLVEPAGLGGIDLVLKKNNYGVRFSVKEFYYRVDIPSPQETFFTLRPQLAAELLYQF